MAQTSNLDDFRAEVTSWLEANRPSEPDFLLPGTPITEAVFKLLLANTNKAMTLDEIQSGLTTAWASVIYLKNLSDEILHRMLNQENDYFIKRAVIRRRRRGARR